MDKAGLGLLIGSLCWMAPAVGGARAADPVPFFKADPKPIMYGPVPLFMPEPKPVMYGPVLPDPSAPECGIDDRACIERHDARVLSLATSSHARQECAESTHPDVCYDAYDMMAGDFVPKGDPILNDPCAWVVLVDQNVATLSSKKLGLTKRVLNRGWKARTFIGACNVSTVAPARPAAVIPMPAWTVRQGKGQPAPAPRVVTVVPVSTAPGPTRAAVSAPAAPAPATPSMAAASVATAPAAPAPSRPAPPAIPTPPATVGGPPGATQPPAFARPATVSDAATSAPPAAR